MSEPSIFIGQSEKREELYLALANRHGLVTGATGTGKTVTLQIMAEGFCNAGVPVFAADVKGDLSGISCAGEPKDFLLERAAKMGFDDYGFEAVPTIFWDLFGEQGHPIRTTITEMGPLLLSRLMDHPVHVRPLMVSKVNTVAQIVFAVAVLGTAALGKPLERLVDYGSIPVALLTALSGAAYLGSWLRHMAEQPHEDGRP